jgi:small nuclear ribonucleoprotein
MPNDLTTRILKDSINTPVIVKLKGGKVIRGVLAGYDEHLNLFLKDAEHLRGEDSTLLGNIIIRGDNVILISPS